SGHSFAVGAAAWWRNGHRAWLAVCWGRNVSALAAAQSAAQDSGGSCSSSLGESHSYSSAYEAVVACVMLRRSIAGFNSEGSCTPMAAISLTASATVAWW